MDLLNFLLNIEIEKLKILQGSVWQTNFIAIFPLSSVFFCLQEWCISVDSSSGAKILFILVPVVNVGSIGRWLRGSQLQLIRAPAKYASANQGNYL